MRIKDRETSYREALRYIENATEMLRTKADKKDKYYEGETKQSVILAGIDSVMDILNTIKP
jgi:hypothetical protein